MSLTHASFVATLAGLSVSGVKTTYDTAPAVDTSGNYPMQFPLLPTSSRSIATVQSCPGPMSITCDLVIVVQRDSLDAKTERFSDTVAIMDALDAALQVEMRANNQIFGWEINTDINEYGWAVIATVEAGE